MATISEPERRTRLQAIPAERPGETLAYLAVVIFAWGGNYTWSKLALVDNGPWAFNAFRYGAAAALLGLVLTLAARGRAVVPVPGERIGIAVIGVLQVAVTTAATTLALTMIDASRTVLIAYSMPIWGMLLSFVMLGERVSRAMILGIVLGLAGLILLCAPWAMDWTSRSAILGSFLALGGTVAWALASVLYRKRRWKSGFWSQIFGQFVAASIVLVPLAVALETRPLTYTPTFGAIMAWNAVGPTTAAFYCWARALDRVPVAKASQILLSPIFGVLLSAAVLGERLTPALLASAVLILAGAALSYIPARSPPAPT